MVMSPKLREIRAGSLNTMSECRLCAHAFADGELMALAMTSEGNQVLCQTCADELLASANEPGGEE